nr:putative polyprotein [Tanacetum cinerariifolium]
MGQTNYIDGAKTLNNLFFGTIPVTFQPPRQPHQDQIQSATLVLPPDSITNQIYISGPQAFYGVCLPNNNRNNNNDNHGNRNNSRGNNNNQGRGNGRQFDWASTQNTVYGTCNRCGIGHIPSQCPIRDLSTIRTRPSANFANTCAQSSNASVNWHSDTGANSNVKPDLEAMDNSEAYYGDNALYVGNAQKSDVYSTFKSFVQMVERQFTTKLKNVQTDWGGEFHNLASFFSSLGIIHRRSCPHTSEQNSFAERHNCYVVETGLTLLAQTYVPQCFWHYAFDIDVYLINRMPSRTSTNKSPFEHIFKRSSDYSFLRVFGCLCFPYLYLYNRYKMGFRSTPCVFLGYSPSHRAYRCLDISTERLYITRHVRFNKAQFPFDIPKTASPPLSKASPHYSSESPYVIPTTDHPSPSSPSSPISSPLLVSRLSPTS